MTVILVLLVTVPAAAMLATGVLRRRAASVVTVVAGLASFAFVLTLAVHSDGHVVSIGFLRVDALSMVFLLATGFLYAATSVYSIGYLADEVRVASQSPEHSAEFARYTRRFYFGLNAFAWSMLCAPSVDALALLWIAIEVTTVVSALLVALDNTEGATEAAWKYVLIASSGLGIALLATIVMYFSGAHVLGDSYDLAFAPILQHAAGLPHVPVRLAFVLAVVGFGTKVGLFPVHTWLPDAHAEAPTPVSALLSGALLASSLYAILRYYEIAVRSVGPAFPQGVLLTFGILSLLLAALYVLEQSDIKRLLAYSSVEHMGILAIGVSFGTPLALAGVLLHVMVHAAGKGNAFMGAGVFVRKFGTKELAKMRAGIDVLPWSGPLFLISIFALAALPPFGIFRSEFEIVAGGLSDAHHWATVALVILVTVAFLGLTAATTRVLYLPAPRTTPDDGPAGPHVRSQPHPADRDAQLVTASVAATGGADAPVAAAVLAPAAAALHTAPASPDAVRGEPSAWMVVPVLAGLAVLVLLGVYPPPDLVDVINRAAHELAMHG